MMNVIGDGCQGILIVEQSYECIPCLLDIVAVAYRENPIARFYFRMFPLPVIPTLLQKQLPEEIFITCHNPHHMP